MLLTILLVILVLDCIALVAVILLQQSEGGALGMGGGPTGMFTARGAGDLLTRTTQVLAGIFFVLALLITLLSSWSQRSSSVVDRLKLNDLSPMAPPAPTGAPQAGGPAPGGPGPASSSAPPLPGSPAAAPPLPGSAQTAPPLPGAASAPANLAIRPANPATVPPPAPSRAPATRTLRPARVARTPAAGATAPATAATPPPAATTPPPAPAPANSTPSPSQ